MHKLFALLFTLMIALLLSACQSAPSTDYDPKVNFGAIRTFSLLAPTNPEDPLSSQRIAAAIRSNLIAKGMTETANAEINVTWTTKLTDKPSRSGLSIGLGSGSFGSSAGIGVGTSIGIPLGADNQVRDIQIEVLSAAGNKLIWRGSEAMTQGQSGEENAKATTQTVNNILALYPPKP